LVFESSAQIAESKPSGKPDWKSCVVKITLQQGQLVFERDSTVAYRTFVAD
jgi:hypothetical protein